MLSRDVEPIGIGGLLLRRAVLGTLLAAGRALTAKEIVEALRQSGATTRPTLTKGPSRVIADLLAHQVRAGKVIKTGPGTFAVAPDRMSRSTRQRCLRWRRDLELLRADLATAPPRTVGIGSPLSDAPLGSCAASERGDPSRTTPSVAARRAAYPSTVPTSLTIEAATVDDVEVLVSLEGALFDEDAGRFDTYVDLSWSQREGRADFEGLLASSDCLVLIARDGPQAIGHLVGYARTTSPTRQPVTIANLRSMYVVPGHRRQGAADLLVRAFVAWATGKGCVEAHVDSYALNEPAQRLYERHGFLVRSTARALALPPAQTGGSA